VGHRVGLDAVVKRKFPSPLPGLEPPIIQPAAQRYTAELSRLLTTLSSFPNNDIFYSVLIYIFEVLHTFPKCLYYIL
jgi:hypothetical protein